MLSSLDHFMARGARQPRLARGDEAVRESPTDPCVKTVMTKCLSRTIGLLPKIKKSSNCDVVLFSFEAPGGR